MRKIRLFILIVTTFAFLSCINSNLPLIEKESYDETTTFKGSTRSDTTSNDNSDDKGNTQGEIIDWEDGGAVELIANEVEKD